MGPVLYAEDSEDDAFLMQRAFKQVNVANRLVVVPNGRRAIEYLSGAGVYADRAQNPVPALVLLDVKMPYESGLDVLQWIRQQPALHSIPVFMLTSSSQESDIVFAYSHGANGYLVKPTSLDAFRELVEDVTALCRKNIPAEGWMHVRGGVPAPKNGDRKTL